MTMQFTEEQLGFRNLARDFFEKEVRPVMAEIDARPCSPAKALRRS